MRMAKKANSWSVRLKALRERQGLTQKQAAERCGVATRTWIAWENDQGEPGRLARQLLRITFPELFQS